MIYFDFGPKSSSLLIFFCNGLLFSFLLFRKGVMEENRASRWLGWFLLLCSLYISPFMLGYAGWYGQRLYREILFFLPLQQVFLLGPVIYFYTRSLLNPLFRLSKKDWLHLVPAGLYLLYSLGVFVVDKWVLDEYYFYADERDKDLAFWYQMAGLISMLLYLGASLRQYRAYRRVVYQEVSFADRILFKWIGHFLIAFSIILLLRVLFFILNPEWGNFGSKYWYYLTFSILFLYIGLNGYANTVKHAVVLNPDLWAPDPPLPDQQATDIPSGKEEAQVDISKWKARIEGLMETEAISRNPDMTLSDLAARLQTNRSILSSVINQGFGMNFNDFINAYRVEAVIAKIRKEQHQQMTLLGIALECGFNSKATFNRAFKKKTGLTPREFIARQDADGIK